MDKPDRNERTMHARGSCDMCRYCGIVSATDKIVTFVCRLKPPVVNAALVQTQQGPQWIGMTSRPNVQKTDWCGSFENVTH